MKLRTRFVLLVVGIVVVPPIMLGLALFIDALTWSAPDGFEGIAVSQRLMQSMRTGDLTVETAVAHLNSSHFGLPVFVLDATGAVLYPPEREGDAATISSILAQPPGDQTSPATVFTLKDESGGTGFLIAAIPLRYSAERFRSIGIIVPLGFVLFIVSMSVLIIRSINRSINRLEAATRRIADGDLDFSLQTSGKDRIASLTRSFETMRRQLKEESDRSARFITGLSHDLKTPLSSITGYIDAIRDGYADTPEKLEKYTSIIQTKTQLLESRISRLIDYAKQETREWKASLQRIPLAEFLSEFVSLVEAEAHARRFTFRADVDLDPNLTVEMDPDMVIRALENLAENAFIYAAPGSEIRIRVFRTLADQGTGAEQPAGRGRRGRAEVTSQSEVVVIEVENSGPGIEPEALPHIFDPLYRGGNGRGGRGFGLGLATVKSVIASHGWHINVVSEPGMKTLFAVTIPVME